MIPLVLSLMAAAPKLEAVTITSVEGRPGLVLSADQPLPPVVVSRSPRRLQVSIPGARLAPKLKGPWVFAGRAGSGRASLPVEAVRIVQRPADVALLFTLPSDVPLGVRQEGETLWLAFGEEPPPRETHKGVSLLGPPGPPVPSPVLDLPSPQSRPAAPVLVPLPEEGRGEASVSVSVEPRPPRALVRITGGAGLAEARVRREGGEVIVTFDAENEAVAKAPAVLPPIDAIEAEKLAALAVVHVRVAPEVPFEVQREEGALVVLFGEAAPRPLELQARTPLPEASAGVDTARLVTPELYRSLFPAGGEEPADRPTALPAASSDQAREGLQIGPLHLRPTLQTSYTDADTAVLDTPQPVNDHYLQIEPRVTADVPLLGGQLTADYALRYRAFSSYDEVGSTSQLANAGLELPLGTRTLLRVHDHVSTGILETTEVDPGQEYFFGLSRFHRNDLGLGAQVQVGNHYFVDLAAGRNDVSFDEVAGFFPYTTTTVEVAAGMTLAENLRASLVYHYLRVPPSDRREVVESSESSLGAAINGDLGPLTHGQVQIDYQDRQAPRAAAGGQSYRGLAVQASVVRDLSASARLQLTARRATDLSGFEQNAFYVSTGARLGLSTGLPLSLSGNLGVGYQWNAYRTLAAELGEPRRDNIFGWSVGLSRSLGRIAFVRADYRRDHRSSNLPGFSTTTDGFLVQVGLGLFGTSAR